MFATRADKRFRSGLAITTIAALTAWFFSLGAPAAWVPARKGSHSRFSMRLGRMMLAGVMLLTISLPGSVAFAAQGGNGIGNAGKNGQGGSNANANSAAPNSDQVCDGDSGGKSDTGHGANQGDAYDNTCPSGASDNGNGEGLATGQPCAGCVGQADDKNPAGQLQNVPDLNNGYECDGNSGIAKTNPAHTGCATLVVPTFGAAAAIADLPCDDTTADVMVTNNDSTGTRNFTATLDDAAAGSASAVAGTTNTVVVTIPNDGASHALVVASNGATLASKSLTVTQCSVVQVLGVNFSKSSPKVLGKTLARTGFEGEKMLILAIVLIGVGLAMLAVRKEPAGR